MPYIDEADREALTPISKRSARSAGELNFQFTQVALDYYEYNGPSYDAINDIVGALEGAKQEFYRRVAVPYEERKRAINGDVYRGA